MTYKELDKWLAENEHMMGWHLSIISKTNPKAWSYWENNQGQTIRNILDWQPTESISDAFQIVEKMAKDGLQVEMGNNYVGDDWYCIFGGSENLADADTLPKAICLAAKKAIEARKGEWVK